MPRFIYKAYYHPGNTGNNPSNCFTKLLVFCEKFFYFNIIILNLKVDKKTS